MTNPTPAQIEALQLVLLFYTIDWTPEKKAEWLRITGTQEATTKVMCDHIRSVTAAAQVGEPTELEALEEHIALQTRIKEECNVTIERCKQVVHEIMSKQATQIAEALDKFKDAP